MITRIFFLICFITFSLVTKSQTFVTKLLGQGIGKSIDRTSDGSYIVGANRNQSTYILFLDSLMDSVGVYTDVNTRLNCIRVTNDGGYIYCGDSSSRALIVKNDFTGNEIWRKDLSDPFLLSYAMECDDAPGGNYYVIYNSDDNGPINPDTFALLDHSGNIIHANELVYNGSSHFVNSAALTPDSGWIISRLTTYVQNTELIKLNAIGDTIWSKYLYDSTGTYSYEAVCTISYSTGGYLAGGMLDPLGGSLLIRTDTSGNILWSRSPIAGDSWIIDMIEAYNSDLFLLVGVNNHQNDQSLLIMRTDSMGNLIWSHQFQGMGRCIAADMTLDQNGVPVVVSSSIDTLTSQSNIYLIFDSQILSINKNENEGQVLHLFHSNCPGCYQLNISEPVTFRFYSTLGQLVFNKVVYDRLLDLTFLDNGIYFYEFSYGKNISGSGKLIHQNR